MRTPCFYVVSACFCFVSLSFLVFPAEAQERSCTINKMVQSPVASTAAFAATYELDVSCEHEAIAVASIPQKLQSGAEIQITIADLFGHNAIAGKPLFLQKGQNTIFFTATSEKKPEAGKYKFSVDMKFLPRK